MDEVRAHLVRHWGEPVAVMPFIAAGVPVNVLKWDVASTDEGVMLYATVGASVQAHAEHRVEFVVGLLPSQDSIGGALAALATFPVLSGPLGVGDTVMLPDPVVRGGIASSFLILPRQEDIVPPLDMADGSHVRFLQVLAVHDKEVQWKRKRGIDWLIDAIFDQELRLSDPYRPAVRRR